VQRKKHRILSREREPGRKKAFRVVIAQSPHLSSTALVSANAIRQLVVVGVS
jgi:hypothetical protein